MKKSVRVLLAILLGTVIVGVAYYVTLPPLNVFSTEFWTFLVMAVFAYGLPLTLALSIEGFGKDMLKNLKPSKVLIIIAAIPVAVLVVGGLLSSTFFNARKYASVITVEKAEFTEDMPEADVVSNISLMDTASAAFLGNKELGGLADMVSQYEVSTDYNQINYQRTPQKVANLEYADFFRWFNNMEAGIPGYVKVDPVGNDAEYVKFEKPMIYVDSAYFHQDLMRKLRFMFPTKIFSSVNFEIDDNGNPYYIVSCVKPRVGLFGAMDVSEVIIFDPCTGTVLDPETPSYSVEETPAWIDNVYDGDLACEKYDWHGILSGGFWNSIIGKRDCKQTTEGFGYIVRDDDVWYYTGVTSVGGDESNIGFIITNARTGEYKYYSVSGAEEYGAMESAQGEVQHMGYTASFPSLINIEGEPTYIMVLKDASGYVKHCALVNVKNPSIVAVGEDSTQKAAKEAYIDELIKNGVITKEEAPTPEVNTKTAEVTVTKLQFLPVGGETLVYITAEDGTVYRGSLAEDEGLILVTEGEILSVTYTETEIEEIRAIVSWTEKVE